MIKRAHEENGVKSRFGHFTEITRIRYHESHTLLDAFGYNSFSAFLNKRRRQVNSRYRITSFGQFQSISSRGSSNLENGSLRRQMLIQIAPGEVVLKLVPRQSAVFFLWVAIVKGSNITNIIAHVVLRVSPSAIRYAVGQLDNEWTGPYHSIQFGVDIVFR